MKNLAELYEVHAESAFNFERYLYKNAGYYSADYNGADWSSIVLLSQETGKPLDGFYMSFADDKTYTVRNAQNYYSAGDMNAKTYSLAVWAMSLNHFGMFLYDKGMEDIAELYFDLYRFVDNHHREILNEKEAKQYFAFLD